MYFIDRTAQISLKDQLAAILREQIQQGLFRPGQKIPSEMELVEKYGISRNTVRLAIDQLVKEGMLIRQRPKGVFVSENLNTETFNTILSFSNEMLRLGKKPGARVLEAKETPMPLEIQAKYGLPPETVFDIYRLRLANEQPVVLERSLVIKRFCPDLLSHDLTQSLYGILQQKYNLRFTHARQRFGAGILSDEQACLLNTTPGVAALKLSRITYLSGNQPIEILESVYRGDLYEFELRLTRANLQDISIVLQPFTIEKRFPPLP